MRQGHPEQQHYDERTHKKQAGKRYHKKECTRQEQPEKVQNDEFSHKKQAEENEHTRQEPGSSRTDHYNERKHKKQADGAYEGNEHARQEHPEGVQSNEFSQKGHAE